MTPSRWGILILVVLLAVSITIVSQNSSNKRNLLMLTLVNINLILAVLLALLLSRNLIKWFFEGRRRFAGLHTRLVASFLGFALVPTALLFIVASGLVTSVVDSWFSPQVQGGLEAAAEVARTRYLDLQEGVRKDASRAAEAIGESSAAMGPEELRGALEAQRKAWDFSALALVSAGDSELPVVAGRLALPSPLPGDGDLQTLPVAAGEKVRVVVPVSQGRHLVAERLIPARDINQLRRITRDAESFSQLAAYKEPIKKGYRLSFLVIALVILFSATWFGFYIARGITTPVHKLVEGLREVARGNMRVALSRQSRDEVGELVDAFNVMIAELARSREELTQAYNSLKESNREIGERRAYMEAILENAATGVIAMDAEGKVTIINRAAAQILRIDPARVRGLSYRTAFAHESLSAIAHLADALQDAPHFHQRELRLVREGRTLTLQAYASHLVRPDGAALGRVVVFDDLTELIRVQKDAAWREVAQRLAHEIKNPLTPIQLSVQRLRKRFAEEREVPPQLVEEAAATILGEVEGLKQLVDEFSRFARMPEPRLSRQPIGEVIRDVAVLYRAAYPDLRIHVEGELGGEVIMDREQMRRVFTNLFENAAQAMDGNGEIRVTAITTRDHWMEIRVADSGPGIAPEVRDKLFASYFSMRKGGTGLGLAIVHRIIEEHGGRIRVDDGVPRGAVFVLAFPLA